LNPGVFESLVEMSLVERPAGTKTRTAELSAKAGRAVAKISSARRVKKCISCHFLFRQSAIRKLTGAAGEDTSFYSHFAPERARFTASTSSGKGLFIRVH
jgi:hypothetical protein